ncbi:hypothetical protein KA005_81040 [bacterium]|nr:hypothetical protein [bacterium]
MRSEFTVNLKRARTSASRDRNRLHNEPILRQYLVLAHQIKNTLKASPSRTLKEIAGWIGYSPARMSQIMSLLFLSTFIQEEILFSTKSFLHQISMNTAHQISRELLWDKQKELWLQVIEALPTQR